MTAEPAPAGAVGRASLGGAFDRPGAHRLDLRAGSVATLEGDASAAVYLSRSGWLAASKSTADGRRLILDVVLPGDMLDPAHTIGDVSQVEIEALSRAVVVRVPRAEWLRRLDERPALAAAVERARQAATARMARRMLQLGRGSAESRLAYTLFELWLRSRTGRARGGSAMHIPMTQQQLGDFCGLSSVHVCRTMGRLVSLGAIEASGKMSITVGDPEALAGIAEVCMDDIGHRDVMGS
ncbi:MAG: Crp/Fnr family transcriptional regulator [Roseicyclus sp.]